MTVIVWDGTTLAADKMCVSGDLKRTVTKIRKINGHLCAGSGDFDRIHEMYAWFSRGAKPEEFPPFGRDNNDWCGLLVITPDRRVLKYERTPYAMDFTESGAHCLGSGRDFAYAALHMGADAAGAVAVASVLCPSCGHGVDTLTLGD